MTSDLPVTQELLSDLFGSYKAEWLRERIFELFAEPSYFPELQTPRPCVLVGGRGTGKTTVLRCLSYEGRFALDGSDPQNLPSWKYFGFYHRVNTNRVTAFQGKEASPQDWSRTFAHYFNLDLCDSVLRFLMWHGVRAPGPELSAEDCRAVAASLTLPPSTSVKELTHNIAASRLVFEAYINNIRDAVRPSLSLQGAPVDALLDRVAGLPQFENRLFFFLLDEYENFLDYQQEVVNTLIKHASGNYTFKVGVKELGWRRRNTLNETEMLISPADYVRIDITEKLGPHFFDFATAVCNERLRRLPGQEKVEIAKLLESLTDDEEAQRLGVQAQVVLARTRLLAGSVEAAFFGNLANLEAYFLLFWAAAQREDLAAVVRSRIDDPKAWAVRFENYKVAVLFTIRRGKRGIRKYYSGWRTFVQLASGNIRYLLELLEHTLLRHLETEASIGSLVSADTQTLAAQGVGKKNLTELEGVSVQGAKLTKLLLGLGRIFQVMAAQPEGHIPEVSQFTVKGKTDDAIAPAVESVLTAAVMHLALVRSPGNKLQDASDTREYDYAIHPIFAPFFFFSHRRKRKIQLSASSILGLIAEPAMTIGLVLEQQGRKLGDEPLPEQLALFEGFYGSG